MPQTLKEQLATDLQKAKAEGGLRSDRIRSIFKQAIAEALKEVKAGSGEIRHVARDAIATAFDHLKGSSADAAADIQASIEGTVEGIIGPQQDAIASTQSQIKELQAQVDQAEAALQADVENALSEMEAASQQQPDTVRPWVGKATQTIRDSEGFATLMEQYAKLRAQLAVLDANLAARYGERYEDVKGHLDQAKAWYDEARVRAEAKGITPVQETQSDFEIKLSELGTAAARKERRIKARLKDLWESARKINA
jgi:chaperonin cofactor prefoldin